LLWLALSLFFQVVVDKVLVHRSLSTLEVLAVGLVAIALFETILGILRTYLFPIRPIVSTLNSARGLFGTCWHFRSVISSETGR